MSFQTLSELISREAGYPVDIVDCGSGPELGVFERQGKMCVP